jgi:phosphoadenosine phosphosulfate reductase
MEQLTMFGQTSLEDKVKRAIDRLRAFEPPEGYYLAFSGGKDSQCIYHLAKEAGVKFDAHNSHTTVDPPELVYFIRENYPDVVIEKPEMTMWRLIVKKRMPPTRMVRYCCDVLKEGDGAGRVVVTGVRWAESNKRRNRDVIEIIAKTKKDKIKLNSDNDEDRRMFETCITKGKRIVNPIVDWADEDVWGYIKSRKLKYCKLYDEGFERLGCVGCPMAGQAGREKEFARWPKYKLNYIKAFQRMVDGRIEDGLKTNWTTGQEAYDWWMEYTKMPDKETDGQIGIDEIDEFD